MASGGMIYTSNFIKIGSDVQIFLGEIYIRTQRHTHRQQGDVISLLLFSKGRKVD
jgi:hypothetical protein